jgi:hypothetical protein
MARDCDKPRDVSTVTCRNCDEGKMKFAEMIRCFSYLKSNGRSF